MLLLLLWTLFTIVLCHICSLLEATLFAVRISTLLERKSAGSRGAGRLLDIKRTRQGDAISAILILNTVAGTVGVTFAGAQASKIFGDVWVGLVSAGLTLLILFLAEIIPKSMAAMYAGALSGLAACRTGIFGRALECSFATGRY